MPGKGQIEPRWKKGESGNPKGKPKGVLNRSTIAKKWLETFESVTNPITKEKETLAQEDLMTLGLIAKARKGDPQAYKMLMDSAYGLQTQKVDAEVANTFREINIVPASKKNATK